MARINIEDKWWTDPRRESLAKSLGNPLLADGLMIRAWRLSIEYWAKNQLIPKHIWDSLEHGSNIIEHNLATIEQEGVYVRGSKESHDWVKLREKSVKAGKISAEIRKQKYGTAQPLSLSPNKTRTRLEQDRTPSNAPTPTPTPTHTLTPTPLNLLCSERSEIVSEHHEKTAEFVVFKISENLKPKIKIDLCNSWAEIYPKDFIDEQLKKSKAWILSNPHKAPKSNYGRFLTTWLSNGWERERKLLKSNPVAITTDDLMDALKR
jgi:hypothetical protein